MKKNLPQKYIYSLVFIFILFIVFYYLSANFKISDKIQNFLNYYPTILRAKTFYVNYNSDLKVDSMYMLNLIAKKNTEYKRFIDVKFDKNAYSGDAFKRIFDRNDPLADFQIIRKINNGVGLYKYINTNKTIAPNSFYKFYIQGEKKNLPEDEPLADIMIKAIYCDISGYDDFDYFLLNFFRDYRGWYGDTHFLLALLFLKENDCYEGGIIESDISEVVYTLIQAQDKDRVFSDLYAERVVFLYWAERGEDVKKEWIDFIRDSIEFDSGWSDANVYDGKRSNPHTTGLALLSLIYFMEGKSLQEFY